MANNPRDKARRKFENSLAGTLAKLFLAQKKRLLAVISSNSLDEAFWSKENTLIADSIFLFFRDVALDSVGAEIGELEAFGIDIAKANEAITRWAREYTFELVKGINTNTRKTIADSLTWYYSNPGTTIGELSDMLTPTFGPVRAEMISVTEVTRAYSQGVEVASNELKQLGIETEEVWETNDDELVCDICGPRDGKVKGDGWSDPPPAHPRCRCWERIQIKDRRKMALVKVNALLEQVKQWQAQP